MRNDHPQESLTIAPPSPAHRRRSKHPALSVEMIADLASPLALCTHPSATVTPAKHPHCLALPLSARPAASHHATTSHTAFHHTTAAASPAAPDRLRQDAPWLASARQMTDRAPWLDNDNYVSRPPSQRRRRRCPALVSAGDGGVNAARPPRGNGRRQPTTCQRSWRGFVVRVTTIDRGHVRSRR